MEHHDNHNVHFSVMMSAKDLEKAEAQGFQSCRMLQAYSKDQCKQYDLF